MRISRPFNKSIIYKSLKRFFSQIFLILLANIFSMKSSLLSPTNVLGRCSQQGKTEKGKCRIMAKTRAAESFEVSLLSPTSRRLGLREGKRRWMNAIFVCFLCRSLLTKPFGFPSHLHCYTNINDSLLSNYCNHNELHV